MPAYSTDHLPRRDRFEYWREIVKASEFSLETEIGPERRHAFSAHGTVSWIGETTLATAAFTACSMHRTRRAIGRSPARSLHIVQHTGSGRLIAAGGVTRVPAGAISVGHCDVVHAYRPDPERPGQDTATLYSVRIPLAILPDVAVVLDRLLPGLQGDNPGLDTLLRSYLAAFFEQAPHLSGPAAEQAVRTLAQLALAARGAIDPRAETGAAAIRAGLLARARRLIERDLHRADLTPARVAAQLGVSVRGLHLAFEPTGESFGRHLLARRLARADRMLRENPHLSVTEAAYACGFEALSTFFRGYRAAYGASPGGRRGR